MFVRAVTVTSSSGRLALVRYASAASNGTWRSVQPVPAISMRGTEQRVVVVAAVAARAAAVVEVVRLSAVAGALLLSQWRSPTPKHHSQRYLSKNGRKEVLRRVKRQEQEKVAVPTLPVQATEAEQRTRQEQRVQPPRPLPQQLMVGGYCLQQAVQQWQWLGQVWLASAHAGGDAPALPDHCQCPVLHRLLLQVKRTQQTLPDFEPPTPKRMRQRQQRQMYQAQTEARGRGGRWRPLQGLLWAVGLEPEQQR
jgi:hypothetical protein